MSFNPGTHALTHCLPQDSDMQKKLLAAAKQVADATAHMVEAAKGCASSPQDKHQQMALRLAAEELRSATTAASNSALKKKIVKKLEVNTLVHLSHILLVNGESGRYITKRINK